MTRDSEAAADMMEFKEAMEAFKRFEFEYCLEGLINENEKNGWLHGYKYASERIKAVEAEIRALKIQLGKCIIQENETLAIAASHGWEYDPDNYTDEKAMKAYREWEERP